MCAMSRRLAKIFLFTLIGLAVVAVLLWIRGSLGIPLDPQALRDWINGVGPAAPIAFVLLVTFRSFLAIPSQLVLIVAGLCFGAAMGALYGALGIAASGMGAFFVTRYVGLRPLERRIPERMREFIDQAGERPTAAFVAVGTAYPVGAIIVYHALAGVTATRVGVFAVALCFGAIARSATYSFFGSSLIAGGIMPILQATAVIGVGFGLPLLFPATRTWLLRVVFARD